eukprot:4317800-Pleurochrysis_carterae.AAC.1
MRRRSASPWYCLSHGPCDRRYAGYQVRQITALLDASPSTFVRFRGLQGKISMLAKSGLDAGRVLAVVPF